jgi:hypothetical protein
MLPPQAMNSSQASCPPNSSTRRKRKAGRSDSIRSIGFKKDAQ